MRAGSVALIPSCAECTAVWLPADEERWQALPTDDEPPEIVFYCPECAERESGRISAREPRALLQLLGQGECPGQLDHHRRRDLVPRHDQVALWIGAQALVNLE